MKERVFKLKYENLKVKRKEKKSKVMPIEMKETNNNNKRLLELFPTYLEFSVITFEG